MATVRQALVESQEDASHAAGADFAEDLVAGKTLGHLTRERALGQAIDLGDGFELRAQLRGQVGMVATVGLDVDRLPARLAVDVFRNRLGQSLLPI
jgi:hypothetical protein